MCYVIRPGVLDNGVVRATGTQVIKSHEEHGSTNLVLCHRSQAGTDRHAGPRFHEDSTDKQQGDLRNSLCYQYGMVRIEKAFSYPCFLCHSYIRDASQWRPRPFTQTM